VKRHNTLPFYQRASFRRLIARFVRLATESVESFTLAPLTAPTRQALIVERPLTLLHAACAKKLETEGKR
jgi:hypothetical protein